MKRLFLMIAVVLLTTVLGACAFKLSDGTSVEFHPIVVAVPLPLYAGPFWIERDQYWYRDGVFYVFSGGVYIEHRRVSHHERPYYDRLWREHRERHAPAQPPAHHDRGPHRR